MPAVRNATARRSNVPKLCTNRCTAAARAVLTTPRCSDFCCPSLASCGMMSMQRQAADLIGQSRFFGWSRCRDTSASPTSGSESRVTTAVCMSMLKVCFSPLIRPWGCQASCPYASAVRIRGMVPRSRGVFWDCAAPWSLGTQGLRFDLRWLLRHHR